MYLYDSKKDLFIDIIDIEVSQQAISNNLNIYYAPNFTIKFKLEDFDYVQNWFSQIYSEDGQLISKKDYIRDIFILGRKSDMKLANTYPISYQTNDIELVIELRCDYLANDEKFTFPELKQLYRDRKIDRILE